MGGGLDSAWVDHMEQVGLAWFILKQKRDLEAKVKQKGEEISAL